MSGRSGIAAAIGWALLSFAAFAAALSLVVAGESVGYQHYLSLAAMKSKPLSVGVLLLQALVVLFALRGRVRFIVARVTALLPSWRLPVFALAMLVSSAIVGRDLPKYTEELLVATALHAMSLATTVLAVRAIPPDALQRLRARFASLLGGDVAFGDDLAPRMDRFALALTFIVTAICVLLAVVVYERHPHLPDEVAYLFQARTFATGRLTLPNPPVPESFALYLIATGAHGWYSPVPPGMALALAPGVWLGAAWLVNPALTGLNVLLTYLVLQPLYGRRMARLGTLLFALSPWNLFLGMGFMPHAFTLCCALLATLSVITTRRNGQARWMWLGGIALGLVATVRQLDALVMAAALGLWAIGLGGRRVKLSGTIGLVLGSMLSAAPLLWYNRFFTGKPGIFPIMSYNDALYGKGANDYGFGIDRGMGWALDPNPGHGPIDGIINSALNTVATHVELFGWSVGSLLLVYFVVLRGDLQRADWLMLGVLALTWLAYFFNYFSGGPDFGARYWFLMIVPLAALSASGAIALGASNGGPAATVKADPFTETRVLSGVALLVAGALLVFMPWRSADKYWHYRGMRPDLATLAAEAGIGNGLVLVSGREVPDYASAAAFNPLDLSERTPIYVRHSGTPADSAVIAAFPTRQVWFVDGPTVAMTGYVLKAGPLSSADALTRVRATAPSTAVPAHPPSPSAESATPPSPRR